MKLSDGFDARRLRPRGSTSWRLRLSAAVATVLALLGVLLSLAGAAALLGQPAALGPLNESPAAAGIFVLIGLGLLLAGLMFWRRCRRRQQRPSELSMARHLMKKRD